MEGDTDVLIICYSPSLVMNATASSTVEGTGIHICTGSHLCFPKFLLKNQVLRFWSFWYLYIAGHVLDEVLSVMKSSLTSNVAVYFSDPTMPKENHTGSLHRHLLQVYGTATPDCDTLCRRRAVILEGIFVVSLLSSCL